MKDYVCQNINGMQDEALLMMSSAYIPNVIWIAIYPPNYCYANKYHIKMAVGRDFKD